MSKLLDKNVHCALNMIKMTNYEIKTQITRIIVIKSQNSEIKNPNYGIKMCICAATKI